MGVDQARRHRPAVKVDDPGRRPAQGLGAGVRSEVDDPPAAHRQAPLDPARRMHGIEDAVLQKEVGPVLRKGGGGEGCK